MMLSIISNNCVGWRMMQEFDLQYNTPLIALQILPEEFTKFCKNITYYLSLDITEYKELSEYHRKIYERMFMYEPYVCGLCGDILIVFQHYKTWEEAKEKWDRRKERVDYDNLAYLFCLDYNRYQKEAQEFIDAHIPNSYVFCRDFDIVGEHYRYSVPSVNPMNPKRPLCFLDKDRPDHYYFEGAFDRKKLWQKN